MTDERLVRIDRHLSEYFLFQTLWVLFRGRFRTHAWNDLAAFDTVTILESWQHLPANVLGRARNKRSHLSNVLSRNEVERDYAYNRRLFWRVKQGWYQFNPDLSVRRKTAEGATWLPVYEVLSLKLIKEFSQPPRWQYLDSLLKRAGLEVPGTPIAAERRMQRRQAEREAEEAAERERQLLRKENFQRQREEMARRHKPRPLSPRSGAPRPLEYARSQAPSLRTPAPADRGNERNRKK